MSDDQDQSDDQAEERPCLHCLMIDLIEEFFEEVPTGTGESGAFDTDEVITAVAKVVAELTSGRDAALRQTMLDQLTREILAYDAEYREQEAMGIAASDARH
jgi:hypothetical protein